MAPGAWNVLNTCQLSSSPRREVGSWLPRTEFLPFGNLALRADSCDRVKQRDKNSLREDQVESMPLASLAWGYRARDGLAERPAGQTTDRPAAQPFLKPAGFEPLWGAQLPLDYCLWTFRDTLF